MSNASLSLSQARVFDQMCPAGQSSLIGQKIKYALDSLSSGFGTLIYLDPTNGTAGADGLSKDTACKTLDEAYAKLTDGKNDVLVYIAGSSSISLSATFTWAKSYTHFIGVSSPVSVANRARIFQTSTATGVSPLLDVTGSGCIFKDLMVFQGVADATSLIAVRVTGQRNYLENVHFAGIGNATQDAAGAASLALSGAAENVFVNCAIGLDTIAAGANSTELSCTSAATRNWFKGCMFYRYINNAGHALVTVGALGIDRYLRFDDCLFHTDSVNQTVTATSVFSLPAMTQGKILLNAGCWMDTDGASGSGAWDSNSRGLIRAATIAPAATAGGGKATKI